MKIKKLTLRGNDLPERLRNIPSPPKEIFILGEVGGLLSQSTLSVVGTRKVSSYGRQVTTSLVEEAARRGITIISGLALGVDAIAHQAALKAGGKTIAVLPSGLDKIYPASHYHLAKDILASGGALISEYNEGTEPFPSNFIARNRLVSGLGDGVLITEAAQKSGTLHTANFALEQGKTVMAVPGNITSPLSAGTNNLIKVGAIPVTVVEDVLLALGLDTTPTNRPQVLGQNKAETDILEMLATGITDGSLLQAATRLGASEFNQTLTMLEITGKIHAIGAGHWSL